MELTLASGAKRSFVAFIMDPIVNMFQAVMNNELNKKGEPKAFNMCKAVGVTLSEETKKTLTGKPLLEAHHAEVASSCRRNS